MKIGIDISQIVYKGSGVARFTEGLVNAICDYDTEHEWTFFFSSFRQKLDSHIVEKIKKKNYTLITLPIPPTALSLMWNRLHTIAVEKFTGKLDWFITSDWTEGPSSMKKATIVHDLVFMRYPETVDKIILKTQQERLNWVKKESTLIFADSESTKKDLETYLTISSEKIVTNYPGVNVDQKLKKNNIESKFKLAKPFILTVGKLEPRKNIEKLIEAYQSLNLKDIDLVIVGPHGWGNISQKNTDSIHFLGYVSNDDLYSLYEKCLFFIFPSIWEGFGYPAVEAMSLGAPTALSDNSSLKEIGEDASYVFDPFNVNSIQKAIHEMVTNETLRKTLQKKGQEKVKMYSWKKYYEKLITTLKSA